MKAVVFDMDGVLIDSEAIHQQAEIHALAAFGLQLTPQDLHPFTGATRELFKTGIAERYGVNLDWDAVFTEKDQLFYQLMENVQPVPNVIPLLHELKAAGLRLGLATSSQKRQLTFVVRKFDLGSLFDCLTCASDITRSKPDPEIFLITAQRLNVPPGECAVIEDSLNGVRAAKAAGMFTIAITTTFPSHVLAEADQIIDSYEEIKVEGIKVLTMIQ